VFYTVSPLYNYTIAQDITLYQAHCTGKNVVIKYKGQGVIECRQGTSAKAKGFATMLFGKVSSAAEEVSAGTLNFSTNVTREDVLFVYSSYKGFGKG
jgi:hypothetical protein